MNKKLLVVVLLVVLVLTFTSCDNSAHYKKLNQMGDDYKVMKIDVTVAKDGAQPLTSNFLFERNANGEISALYVLREYQQFGVGEDTITLPSGQISTQSGSCQIANGVVGNLQGDQISLDLANVSNLSVNFDDHCLTNVTVNDDVLTATVTDIKVFLGSEIDCSNAQVTANVEKLDGFVLTYTANGCNVTVSYVITK